MSARPDGRPKGYARGKAEWLKERTWVCWECKDSFKGYDDLQEHREWCPVLVAKRQKYRLVKAATGTRRRQRFGSKKRGSHGVHHEKKESYDPSMGGHKP